MSDKQYLKMADEFSLPVKDETLEVYCEQHIGESFSSGEIYVAHAINSHDDLVCQRDQLLASLKELLSSKAEPGLFAGVAAADNAAKLIKSIEDGEWISAGHSPDAGKMVPDGWQLVPVVATKAMWAAWDSAPCNNEDDAVNIEEAYSAMLAAAPKLGGE